MDEATGERQWHDMDSGTPIPEDTPLVAEDSDGATYHIQNDKGCVRWMVPAEVIAKKSSGLVKWALTQWQLGPKMCPNNGKKC